MLRAAKIAEIVQAVSLGLWLGVIVMSVVVAAQVFPLMRELDPQLGAYPLFDGDHSPLAGGRVAAAVFVFADVFGFVCLMLSGVATVIWIMGSRARRPVAAAVRATLLMALVAVFGYHLIVHGSALNGETRAYWAAAEAGETEVAEKHRAVIRDMHPMSRNLMAGTMMIGLASLVTGLWCLATAEGTRHWAPGTGQDTKSTGEGGPSANVGSSAVRKPSGQSVVRPQTKEEFNAKSTKSAKSAKGEIRQEMTRKTDPGEGAA